MYLYQNKERGDLKMKHAGKADWMLPEMTANNWRKTELEKRRLKRKKLEPVTCFLETMHLSFDHIKLMIKSPTKIELKFVEKQFVKLGWGSINDLNEYYKKHDINRHVDNVQY